jgi:predicted nucleotidyltransferase
VAKLWLYGSVARGDATKASDVDLLVDLEPSADRKRRLATTAFRP